MSLRTKMESFEGRLRSLGISCRRIRGLSFLRRGTDMCVLFWKLCELLIILSLWSFDFRRRGGDGMVLIREGCRFRFCISIRDVHGRVVPIS